MQTSLYQLLEDVKLPRMIPVRQKFDPTHIAQLEQEVCDRLSRPQFANTLRPGMQVAITAGSRGIKGIDRVLRAVASFVRERGAPPFIVPAMGSHGGATAEGQRAMLASLGVTEQSVGCEIRSSMQTVPIGQSPEGHTVHIDRNAAEADGIIVVGKVKPHTAFRGEYESGVMKMMTIGLGKQHGAELCHAAGFKHMAKLVPMFAHVILQNANVLFGIALMENAYHDLCRIVALTPAEIPIEEPKLLLEAKDRMGRLLFDEIAVLVVDRIGKDISGEGMDPNITGRFATPYATSDFHIQKIAVLDLTEGTHGIMIGAGAADTCTKRMLDKANLEAGYVNSITSTVFCCEKVPMTLKNDFYAVAACVRTCNEVDRDRIRMVRIADTLRIDRILISESMLADALQNPSVEVLGEAAPWPFDPAGNLW